MNLRALLLLVALPALPSQAPGPARLEGIVVDPLQQPVGNALVTAELDGEEIARTHSDGSGMFVFGKVPQQFVVVRATTATPDIGAAQVDLLGETRGFARIVLMPARKVTGTVRDDAGAPAAGAWITAASTEAQAFSHASCRTQSDANGHYELSHVTMGKVAVRAWADGCDAFEGEIYRALDARLDVAEDEQLDCVVDTECRQARTFVLVGATAAQLERAALHVQAFHGYAPCPLPPPLQRPRPTAPGTWVIRGWPNEDELWVHVVLPDAAIVPALLVSTAGVRAEGGTFRIGPPSEHLTGVLVTQDDVSTAGLLLLVQPLAGPLHNATRVVARTAADGRFAMRNPAAPGAPFALRVLDPSAVVAGGNPDRAWFVAPNGPSPRIAITHASSIRLHVVAPDETPVHGAEVLVFAAHPQAIRIDGLAVPLRSHGRPLAFGTSDLDGDVEILGLDLRAGDALACLVMHPTGHAERPFTIAGPGRCNLGTLRLDPAATLLATVRRGGQPTAREPILLRTPYWWLTDNLIAAPARDGRLRIPGLLPGSYQMHGLGYTSPVVRCELVAGGELAVTLR